MRRLRLQLLFLLFDVGPLGGGILPLDIDQIEGPQQVQLFFRLGSDFRCRSARPRQLRPAGSQLAIRSATAGPLSEIRPSARLGRCIGLGRRPGNTVGQQRDEGHSQQGRPRPAAGRGAIVRLIAGAAGLTIHSQAPEKRIAPGGLLGKQGANRTAILTIGQEHPLATGLLPTAPRVGYQSAETGGLAGFSPFLDLARHQHVREFCSSEPHDHLQPHRTTSALLLLIGAFKLFKALLLVLVGTGTLRLLHRDVAEQLSDRIVQFRVDPHNRYLARGYPETGRAGRSQAPRDRVWFGLFACLAADAGRCSAGSAQTLRQYFTVGMTTLLDTLLEILEPTRCVTPISHFLLLVVNVAIVAHPIRVLLLPPVHSPARQELIGDPEPAETTGPHLSGLLPTPCDSCPQLRSIPASAVDSWPPSVALFRRSPGARRARVICDVHPPRVGQKTDLSFAIRPHQRDDHRSLFRVPGIRRPESTSMAPLGVAGCSIAARGEAGCPQQIADQPHLGRVWRDDHNVRRRDAGPQPASLHFAADEAAASAGSRWLSPSGSSSSS